MFGKRASLGDDTLLVGGGFRDSRFAQSNRAADCRVAFSFCSRNLSVAFDARDVGAAHVGDVLVLVADLADGEADHLKPHLAHVVHAGGAHALGDHLGLFHNLFDSQLADDAAQMAFHHEADKAFALVGRLGQELLGRGEDRLLVRANFDLGHSFHGDGDALLGVEILLGRDVEAHEL